MSENKKFNLKNRPHRVDYSSDEHGLLQFAIESTEWFEGFETRQRQNLADFEKAIKNTSLVNDPCFIRCWEVRCWEALRNYIKLEVLGVEPKIKEEMKSEG